MREEEFFYRLQYPIFFLFSEETHGEHCVNYYLQHLLPVN